MTIGVARTETQLEFERNVKVGDKVMALWTSCGNYYEAEVEVVAVNAKSYKVRITWAAYGYPVGYTLNIPNFRNHNRWSWNCRLKEKGGQ